MAKKKSGSNQTKATSKAVKKAKTAQKVERKEKKKTVKMKDQDDQDEDLESILENMRREWEDAHTVTEEIVEGPPSRRANATLIACPSGNYLWCIGGEYFSDDGKAYFYNDVFRYTPERNEWRKFVSQICPGPRSAHAVVASPAAGGKLFLFGGEFSSLYQNTFHHYRDFWCFDVSSHNWDRIETKVRPSARSGCRMAMWKHYVFLFGGFYDPGIRTNYLNDLWYFDTQEYLWRQVEFREMDRKPSPRSGFSFLPTAEGIVLHGGYCKEYAKGKRPVGVMLDDTWFLRISLPSAEASNSKLKVDSVICKWEKRKKVGYAPSLRSGCTMALWGNKSMGVLFGGVTDEDTSEETLESVFHNDLYGYQLVGNGRWLSLNLKMPKKKAKQKTKTRSTAFGLQEEEHGDEDADNDGTKTTKDNELMRSRFELKSSTGATRFGQDPDLDPNDPAITIPLVRYNAMLAVLRNTLYIYGGIYERGSREYTLDDFYALQLDKMEQYQCLHECDVVIPDGDVESSSDDEDEDDEGEDDEGGDEREEHDEDDDETQEAGKDDIETKKYLKRLGNKTEPVVEVQGELEQLHGDRITHQETVSQVVDDLRAQATQFMGVAKDSTRSAEDVISTPLPGETLAMFYARSREYWSGKAHQSSTNRGKLLRKDGFSMAEEKYASYKPILEEVEKILAEAGLDEDEIKRGAAVMGGPGEHSSSRNRR